MAKLQTFLLWERPAGLLQPWHRQAAGSVTCTHPCSVFRVMELSSCSLLQVGRHIIVGFCKKRVCLVWDTLPSGSIEQGLAYLHLSLI